MRYRSLSVTICAFAVWTASTPAQPENKPKAAQHIHEVHHFDTGDQGVIRLVVSPDGHRALSAGTDGTVRLWDLKNGKEHKEWLGHQGQSFTVAFHPNGKRGISGGEDHRVVLWDLAKGEKVRDFRGHTGTVYGVAFSPDGHRIASGSEDKTIRLWDADTGKELNKLEGHTDSVMAVAFSPDGKQLASASADKTVRLWSLNTGKGIFKLEGHTAIVRDVAFSSDGKRILSGALYPDGTGRVWNAGTGKELRKLDGIPQGVNGVALSPKGGQALLSGGYQFALWDWERGVLLHRFWSFFPTDAVFLPDGEHVLLGSHSDRLIRLVQVPKNAPLHAAPPVTGKHAKGVEAIDAVMLKYLNRTGTSTGSVTVARGRQTLYSRGYGWVDHDGTVASSPDQPIAIGSCMKPVTAAMIRQLALNGKLDLNASVFKVLKIKPAGPIVDPRVHDITLLRLLRHEAGWQASAIGRAIKSAADAGTTPPPALWSKWADTVLSHVMTEKLEWAPGEKYEYDNIGYAMLMYVVTKASGMSQSEYIRTQLCEPFGVETLRWVLFWGPPPANAPHGKGEPPRLWGMYSPADAKTVERVDYPHMSTPALCTFMRCYWKDGTPRDSSNQSLAHNGSNNDCTAQVCWRSDGINIAWTFYGRSGLAGNDDIANELNQVIDQLIKDKVLPPPPKPKHNLLVNGSFEEGPSVGDGDFNCWTLVPLPSRAGPSPAVRLTFRTATPLPPTASGPSTCTARLVTAASSRHSKPSRERITG
jgi:WD40 repeat protein